MIPASLVEWSPVIAAVAAPVGGAIGVIGNKLFNRSVHKATAKLTNEQAEKTDAEASQVIANAAVMLVAPLQSQIAELTSRVGTLETENTATKTRLQFAIDYIRELRTFINNHLPDKTPPTPPASLGL